jgi:hypothetical protein
MKRGGGRRYYRPEDVDLLRGIKHLLYGEGYTIKGVKRILKERGVRYVMDSWRPEGAGAAQPAPDMSPDRASGAAPDKTPDRPRPPPMPAQQVPTQVQPRPPQPEPVAQPAPQPPPTAQPEPRVEPRPEAQPESQAGPAPPVPSAPTAVPESVAAPVATPQGHTADSVASTGHAGPEREAPAGEQLDFVDQIEASGGQVAGHGPAKPGVTSSGSMETELPQFGAVRQASVGPLDGAPQIVSSPAAVDPARDQNSPGSFGDAGGVMPNPVPAQNRPPREQQPHGRGGAAAAPVGGGPPHSAGPAPMGAPPVAPTLLSASDAKAREKLQSALYELGECRRVLFDALRAGEE